MEVNSIDTICQERNKHSVSDKSFALLAANTNVCLSAVFKNQNGELQSISCNMIVTYNDRRLLLKTQECTHTVHSGLFLPLMGFSMYYCWMSLTEEI